jgi:hypothetical protein
MRQIGGRRHRSSRIASGTVRDGVTVLHRTEGPTQAECGSLDAVHRMQRML